MVRTLSSLVEDAEEIQSIEMRRPGPREKDMRKRSDLVCGQQIKQRNKRKGTGDLQLIYKPWPALRSHVALAGNKIKLGDLTVGFMGPQPISPGYYFTPPEIGMDQSNIRNSI